MKQPPTVRLFNNGKSLIRSSSVTTHSRPITASIKLVEGTFTDPIEHLATQSTASLKKLGASKPTLNIEYVNSDNNERVS